MALYACQGLSSSPRCFLLIFQISAQEPSLTSRTGPDLLSLALTFHVLAPVTFTAMCNFILFLFAISKVAKWSRPSTLEPDSEFKP